MSDEPKNKGGRIATFDPVIVRDISHLVYQHSLGAKDNTSQLAGYAEKKGSPEAAYEHQRNMSISHDAMTRDYLTTLVKMGYLKPEALVPLSKTGRLRLAPKTPK